MINYITGTIKAKKQQAITVDIGNIGLAVCVAQESVFTLDQKVELYVHLHWNQEQGPTLFGFCSEEERTVFLLITSCSGMGPKIGLAVLANLGVDRFLEVVQAGDEQGLSEVQGIGPKKAERVIVQLKHKVAMLINTGFKIKESGKLQEWHTITQVLQSLNYSNAEVTDAVRYVRECNSHGQATFDQKMRQALSFLSKKA